MSLLPRNATQLERLAAEGLAEIKRVPIRIRELHDPATCGADLLPYLAWARSVDRWDEKWPVDVKRKAIRDSYYSHAHKGTIGALRRVIDPIGYIVDIVEWFNDSPPAEPGTFRLEISTYSDGLTEEMYNALVLFIDDAKPASRHLTELSLQQQSPSNIYVAACLISANVLTIHP